MVDRNSRSGNVVVRGLKSSNVSAAKDDFFKLCVNILRVNICVMAVRSFFSADTFHFTLENGMQALNVLNAKGRLRGTNVFIQRDYTSGEQNTRHNLRRISKHLKNFNENLKVRPGEFCLFVNDKELTWSNGKLTAISNDDANYLRNILSASNYSVDIISTAV